MFPNLAIQNAICISFGRIYWAPIRLLLLIILPSWPPQHPCGSGNCFHLSRFLWVQLLWTWAWPKLTPAGLTSPHPRDFQTSIGEEKWDSFASREADKEKDHSRNFWLWISQRSFEKNCQCLDPCLDPLQQNFWQSGADTNISPKTFHFILNNFMTTAKLKESYSEHLPTPSLRLH